NLSLALDLVASGRLGGYADFRGKSECPLRSNHRTQRADVPGLLHLVARFFCGSESRIAAPPCKRRHVAGERRDRACGSDSYPLRRMVSRLCLLAERSSHRSEANSLLLRPETTNHPQIS